MMKTQSTNILESFEMQMIGIKHLSDMLGMDDNNKIKLAHDVYKANGVPTTSLPKYVDNNVAKPIDELLKHYKNSMSVAEFNTKMIKAELLELKECNSTRGKKKECKSLTSEGLKYGKNLVSPKNNNETQPHYYESKFQELLDLIN